MKRSLGFVCFALAILSGCRKPQATEPTRKGEFIAVLGGERLYPHHRDPHIKYGLSTNAERYFVHVPSSYSDDSTYGLIVFTDSDDTFNELPPGWASVLDSRKYLFIAAQNAGNDQDQEHRLELAVMGALEMVKRYKIDPNRVYSSGFSGGARMAGLLGFYQSDVFRGTIQNCGADFFKSVPSVAATSWVDTAGYPYGVFDATDNEIAGAKQVRFALITGTNDFRRGNILDIYNGGFAHEGFHAKLFEVPGMAHDICDGATLSAVLDFLESST